MGLGSYKPRAGQLQPTPKLRTFFLTHFKGVPAKQIRMSGDLFDSVNTFMETANIGQTIDEELHRKLLLGMVSAFRQTLSTKTSKDAKVKKRRYETGYATKNFQILMTHSTYPVPHLPWMGISLVTLDVGRPGTNDQVIRYTSWDINFDQDVDDNIVEFYRKTITRPGSLEDPYSEGLVDMIFEMVKPPDTFTDMTTLAKSLKAA